MGWLFSRLAMEWGYLRRVPPWQGLWEDDDEKLAVGRASSARCGGGARSRSTGPEEKLVLWLTCHANSRGSDLRLPTGELFRTNQIRRQHIETKWGSCQVLASGTWRSDDPQTHIEALEPRDAPTELKRRCRAKEKRGLKCLHLLDSAMAIGVLAMRRSSSHGLQRVERRFDTLGSASGGVPIVSFCRSSQNPADYPSRVRKKVCAKTKGGQI